MCYRDMTFCGYWVSCKVGKECPRAFTPEVKEAAEEWMGPNAPVCYYMEKPHCYEEKE